MDIQTAFNYVTANLTPVNVILFLMFLGTTVVAEHQEIKASSLYGIVKVLVMTAVDQAWPQKVATAPVDTTSTAQ